MIGARILAGLFSVLLLAAGGCEEKAADAGAEAAKVAEGLGPEAGRVALPSGDTAELLGVLNDAEGPDGQVARFRFLLPGLRAGEDRVADMTFLCEGLGLAMITGMEPAPGQIVIALSDRDVPFGEAAPDAVQFFEAFHPEGTSCIWEMY